MSTNLKVHVHNGRHYIRQLGEGINDISEARDRWIAKMDELDSLVRSDSVNVRINELRQGLSQYVSEILLLSNNLSDFIEKQLLSYSNSYEGAQQLINEAVRKVESMYARMKGVV